MYSYQIEQLEETLARAIQKLTGSTKEEFIDDTIVGTDVNQIRHLFFFLKTDRIPVTITYQSESYRAFVDEVANTSIIFSTETIEEGPLRRCNIRFEAFSVLYQFEVLIQQFAPNRLIIKIPYFIQSARHRKYKRVSAGDLHMRFITIYQPYFISSADNQVVLNRFRHIVYELEKDIPDIHLVYRIIMEEIGRISPHHKVSFFKEESDIELIDEIVRSEKKTLYVDDTNRTESLYEPVRYQGITNLRSKYLSVRRESGEESAIKYMEGLRREYLSDHVHKFICSPVKIFNKVVGTIFVYTTLLEARYISIDQAHLIDIMTSLLGYAMSKIVIGRSYFGQPVTPILNMSISGLLFRLIDEEIFDYLIFHDRLKVSMQIKHNILNFQGEISRYFPSENGYNIGINFYAGEPEDYKNLESYIFEQSRRKVVPTGQR